MISGRPAGGLADRAPLPEGAAWIARAFAAARSWFDAAPPELSARLARIRDRVSRAQGQTTIEGALTAPAATPFLALTEAFRRELGLPEDGAIDAVGEGTLALYFQVRVEDDIVDEPAAYDPSFLYAAEIFASASVEAFARAIGDRPSFWAFRREVLRDLAAVSAWELDVYRTNSPSAAAEHAENDASRLGEKLLPIAIPLAACAVIAGEDRDLGWIRTLSVHLGRALQIANDLLNARDDHAARRLTPTLAALYAGGRVAPHDEPSRVWPILASDPALDRMLSFARTEAAAAAATLSATRTPALRDAVIRSAAALDDVPARLLALTLGARR